MFAYRVVLFRAHNLSSNLIPQSGCEQGAEKRPWVACNCPKTRQNGLKQAQNEPKMDILRSNSGLFLRISQLWGALKRRRCKAKSGFRCPSANLRHEPGTRLLWGRATTAWSARVIWRVPVSGGRWG